MMHPVARFNLGKGPKETKIHIVISGKNGKGGDLEFQPSISYPFWNNRKNEFAVSADVSSRIYLNVWFEGGDRYISSLSFIAPNNLEILSINSTRLVLDFIAPLTTNESSIRGLDPNNYRAFVYDYDNDSLMANDNFQEKIVISTRYKGNYINFDLSLQVI